MVPEHFVPHAVSELPELICAAGLLSGCPRREHCKLDIVFCCCFAENFSFNFCFKIHVLLYLAHSLLFIILIYHRTERGTLPVYLDSTTGNLKHLPHFYEA